MNFFLKLINISELIKTKMKRTIILFAIISAFIIAFVGISQDAMTSHHSACCDMVFWVYDGGQPVSNCEVTIVGTQLSCTTGANGQCTIFCVPEVPGTLIAKASCSGGQTGETEFIPCGVYDGVRIDVSK